MNIIEELKIERDRAGSDPEKLQELVSHLVSILRDDEVCEDLVTQRDRLREELEKQEDLWRDRATTWKARAVHLGYEEPPMEYDSIAGKSMFGPGYLFKRNARQPEKSWYVRISPREWTQSLTFHRTAIHDREVANEEFAAMWKIHTETNGEVPAIVDWEKRYKVKK